MLEAGYEEHFTSSQVTRGASVRIRSGRTSATAGSCRRSRNKKALVANARNQACARSLEGRASRHVAADCEVTVLDLFFIAIVIVFFALMWGFTKAAERL